MAFDPNDPADKKILADAIEEANAAVAAKNAELLKELKEARKGKAIDPAELEKLEAKIDALEAEKKTLEKTAKDASKRAETAEELAKNESGFVQKLLVDNGLTEALVKANVAKQFLPAVKAMLSGQVALKVDGENRVAVVGDKPLADFVGEWAKGEDGKHYIAAPANGGGGAQGGTDKKASGKTVNQEGFNAMKPAERAAFFAEGGTISAE